MLQTIFQYIILVRIRTHTHTMYVYDGILFFIYDYDGTLATEDMRIIPLSVRVMEKLIAPEVELKRTHVHLGEADLVITMHFCHSTARPSVPVHVVMSIFRHPNIHIIGAEDSLSGCQK